METRRKIVLTAKIQILDIIRLRLDPKMYENVIEEAIDKALLINSVSITEGKLSLWTNNDVDAAYLMGCINVGGMDALQDELNRLKELGLKPHQAVGKARGKSGN